MRFNPGMRAQVRGQVKLSFCRQSGLVGYQGRDAWLISCFVPAPKQRPQPLQYEGQGDKVTQAFYCMGN